MKQILPCGNEIQSIKVLDWPLTCSAYFSQSILNRQTIKSFNVSKEILANNKKKKLPRMVYGSEIIITSYTIT